MKIKGIKVTIPEQRDLTEQDLQLMQTGGTNDTLERLSEKSSILIGAVKERNDYVGATPFDDGLILLFKEEISKKDVLKVIDDIKALGFESDYFGRGEIDERYLNHEYFKGFVVDLPPAYVDKEIQAFFQRNSLDMVVNQKINENCVTYSADLGLIELMFVTNSQFLAVGMTNQETLMTTEISTHYKKIIKDFEKQYLKWRETHPNIVA